MRAASVLARMVGVERATVIDAWFEDVGRGTGLVVSVRVWKRSRSRCGRCQRPCPGYDRAGRRRWRALDAGSVMVFVEADLVRVRCVEHGVVTAHVPWARHDVGHTREVDAQVAWLAVHTSKSAVTQLMRIGWRTVGSMLTRVLADAEQAARVAGRDRLDGLRRIGIDEISYRRGQKYVVVVVDHDTGHLVWAGEGRTKQTVRSFFDELGADRSAQITHVSADGADYIGAVVADRCPDAVRCADPFHVVQWVNDALARVRIDAWHQARLRMRSEPAPLPGWARRHQHLPARDSLPQLKGARFALAKNPENLTDRQHGRLDWIAANHPTLWRAYQLKENLRLIFRLPADQAAAALDAWIGWARRCRIPAFVELQRRIRRHREQILASITHQMNNALVEAVNTKIRLLTRIAFGFHSAHALIAIAMLSLGPHRPALPGR